MLISVQKTLLVKIKLVDYGKHLDRFPSKMQNKQGQKSTKASDIFGIVLSIIPVCSTIFLKMPFMEFYSFAKGSNRP